MGFPGYIYPDSQHHVNFFDETGCHPDRSMLHSSGWELHENDLGYLHDDYNDYVEEDLYDIEELMMLERLMYEQREVSRMRLTSQLKEEQYAESDCTFVEKLMLKQQRLRQFLDKEEMSRFDSKFMNQLYDTDGYSNGCGQPWEKNNEKHSCGQMSSVEQYPEQLSITKSSTQSDSSKTSQPLEPRQKSRHCRHFLKGHCKRGISCGFRHDHSVFCTDMQKVFLGGLPAHMTSSSLRKELEDQGYTVLNNPKILRWFSPQVCLGSVEEAQRLVEQGTITIDTAVVRVRPFETFTQDHKKKQPDEVERSVFLGGLNSSTTVEMIKDELGKMGLVVVNMPVLKAGYSPQVVFETFKQARTLLNLMQVEINGALVNVRPFANIRSSSGKKKKRTL